MQQSENNYEQATLGGGCFWCVEAVYQRLNGVISVESGYSGGHVENPTYKQVKQGDTGHAEVVRITFDPTVVPFAEVLKVFLLTHNPTELNRQGEDIGPQYRSVIFYHNEEQKKVALEILKTIEDSKYYSNPIVTEVSPLTNYYKAEDYHQNYFNTNPSQPFCSLVVKSKVDKFYKLFKDKSKDVEVTNNN